MAEAAVPAAVSSSPAVFHSSSAPCPAAQIAPPIRKADSRLRPVFDRGVLPYKLVIGQSGVVVKPKVYIAFGVSGAVNHVTGITDSDVIVAVNRDPEAAIFGYCSYGIVGDMDEVCDAMIAQLKARG